VSIWECGNALTNQEVTLKQVLTTNASTSVRSRASSADTEGVAYDGQTKGRGACLPLVRRQCR
jgi:hypothetical protein